MNLIKQRQEEKDIICSLDPLRVDEAILLVPQYNKNKDIAALIQLLTAMLPKYNTAAAFSYIEAAAAMRDIGILLGSLKRHGIEPAQAVLELEPILFMLGGKLDLPPRDTVISYTLWNPPDERQRNYTDFPDESNLMKQVRDAMLNLEEAIYDLVTLAQQSPLTYKFSQICEQAIDHFRPMIDGVVQARKSVSTQVFSLELRAYYDEITLRGRSYLGPGAVEMPLFVFEHILWSCDNTDPDYKSYKEGYLPYIFPELRKIYRDFANKPSLITQLKQSIQLKPKKELEENLINSGKILLKLCTLIRSFRLPHKNLAADAYEAGRAQRDHGSGGYSVKTLSHIDHIMQESIVEVKQAFEKFTESSQVSKRALQIFRESLE